MFYLAPSGQKLIRVVWVRCKDCPHHEAQHLCGQDFIFIDNIIYFYAYDFLAREPGCYPAKRADEDSDFSPDTIPGRQGVLHQVWQASLRTCSLWLPPPSWWLTGSTSENIGAENTKRLGCMDRCRPSKHRFAFLQPATLFYLLQIASKETAKLVRKYTSCLKSQKWCNWNTEFPTIIYFMAIQIQFNSNAFNIKNWFLQLLNISHWFTIWFSFRSPKKFTQRRPGCSDWEKFHTFHHLLDEEGVGVASSL